MIQQSMLSPEWKAKSNSSGESKRSGPDSSYSLRENLMKDSLHNERLKASQNLLKPAIDVKRDSLLAKYALLKELNSKRQPKFSYRIEEEWERVKLNISGTIFETYKKTLTQKEGSIFKLNNIRNYYDPRKDEYYFDRNPKAFEAIFVFMQCGILYQPPKVPYKVFIEELQFFGFGDKAMKLFEEHRGRPDRKIMHENRDTCLSRIWEVLEFPETNKWSRFLTSFSMFVIMMAVCLFSVDTLPEVKSNQTAVNLIKHMEYFCVAWFTIEILLRFISSPVRCKFFMEIMNVIDIVSLIPYFLEMLFQSKSFSKVFVSSLRILRMARIFNLLKLYRYSRAIRVMAKTLYSSVAELLMLLFFVAIGMMLFSPLLYYFEFDDEPKNEFKSIPHVFWFCIVTTTTVGYGDVVPATAGMLKQNGSIFPK